MSVRDIQDRRFKIGDLVTVKSIGEDKHFCIIGFKYNQRGERLAILKGIFKETHVIEQPISELRNLLIRGKL